MRDAALHRAQGGNDFMAIRITKDGRTILTGLDYTIFRQQIYFIQGGKCLTCGRWCSLDGEMHWPNYFMVHHKDGRGGGKRDDIHSAVEGVCSQCHSKTHNPKAVTKSAPWSELLRQ